MNGHGLGRPREVGGVSASSSAPEAACEHQRVSSRPWKTVSRPVVAGERDPIGREQVGSAARCIARGSALRPSTKPSSLAMTARSVKPGGALSAAAARARGPALDESVGTQPRQPSGDRAPVPAQAPGDFGEQPARRRRGRSAPRSSAGRSWVRRGVADPARAAPPRVWSMPPLNATPRSSNQPARPPRQRPARTRQRRASHAEPSAAYAVPA
jgi:hypothetical protein